MAKMGPGIDKNKILLIRRDRFYDTEKMCVILFDIMPLQIIHEKASAGTSALNSENAQGHVLVFMFQATKNTVLTRRFQGISNKQRSHIVAYYFIEGSIEPMLLAETIKEVVHAVMKTTYTVLAVVCNHSSLNVTTMDLLSQKNNHSLACRSFKFLGRTIFIVYDVPQLYLSIRNHFHESGEIVLDKKTARWSHLIEAVNFIKGDPIYCPLIIMEDDINLTEESKKDVQLAIATLSRKTAVSLRILSECGHRRKIYKDINDMNVYMDSAVVIAELYILFSCTSGPRNKDEHQKGYKECVKKDSFHLKKWAEYIRKLKTVRFPTADDELKLRSKRCIECYINTLLSLRGIWKYLSSKSVKSLNLECLNQNKLQRMFKLIKNKFHSKQLTSKDFTTALQAVEKHIDCLCSQLHL